MTMDVDGSTKQKLLVGQIVFSLIQLLVLSLLEILSSGNLPELVNEVDLFLSSPGLLKRRSSCNRY